MNIKDDPVYQDKLRKMHAVRRYLKIREKVYIARRDAGFNVKEEERVRAWLSEYACYLEADAHWLKEDYERRMGKDEPSYEPSIVIPKGDVEKAVKYGCFSQVLGSIKNKPGGIIMQYEIRAYDALYDAKTRRIAYWDVCSDERHKTVETRHDAAYEFIDCINPDDDAVKTEWQYAKEYGEWEIQNLAWRFSIREMAKYFGGRRDYIVCVIRQDFNKNGALVGEQCVGRCDVTITVAGVTLHVVDVEGGAL